MSSKANFWKFIGFLAITCAVAITTAYVLISKHQRKARFERAARITGGDPHAGIAAIERFGCGTCHTIPGIPNATSRVGPNLTEIRSRNYVAGVLENRPANMQRWIMNPLAVDPKTAMPNLGVGETDALNIVAYLYTLE